jgi:3-oxoadipate enol-lactonase
VPGRLLHFREAGPAGSDRVLLLLHGFPLHSAMWQPQLAEPPAGWRVIAPDLPGFGGSEPVAGEAMTMAAAAEAVVTLLRELDARSVTVAGLSMGGYVAFALLRSHPHMVGRLVLCDTRAEPDTEEVRRGRLQSAAKVRRDGTAAFMDAMLPRLLAPGTPESNPGVAGRIRQMMEEADPDAVAAALLGMAARPDSTPLLPTIAVPTLVVGGEKDGITPPDELERMAAAVPGARMEVIPGAGHMPNLEDATSFNRVLDDFLQQPG